jgi:hypothetical protein
MSPVVAVLSCALLFAVFGALGLLRRGRAQGCAGCTTSCPVPRKESRHGGP